VRPDPRAATRPLASADPLIGTLVAGRYRVDTPIGRGGMGVVFHAEHIATGRRVALKVLGPQWALHKEARGRFVAEARATHRIDHPDVVGVLDAGELTDGRPFIAMEFLQGESLLAEVRRGALTVERALQIARSIADVLVAAHAKGIVHRDLKCDNVMILAGRPTDDRSAPPRIKLLDFGLAAALRDDPSARLTTPGIVMGTPAYMAPEQGRGAPATPSFDVYGLGVVLFEMLAGTTPFGDGDALVVIGTKMTRPAPSLATMREDLPPALVRLVDECLARDPDARPADMVALRSRLESITAPARARRARVSSRKRTRTLRLVVGATLLVALRLVAPRLAHGEPAIATPVSTSGVDTIPLAALAIVPDEPRSHTITPIEPPTPAIAPPVATTPTARARLNAIDTPACARTRAQAQDARAAHDWAGVLRHLERRACWGPMLERERLRVLALAELHRFSECVVSGTRSRDPQVRRTVELCRKRA
jgi:eukaryotic-like serine/threonine-protein kinase